MFKKKQFFLLMTFCFVIFSLNAMTEVEKQEMAERIKKGFIAKLDSIIANNKPIISENETYSDESAIKMFGGDSRQILIFYKYMLYGDKFTQKKGIDGMVRWYGHPQRTEKYKQDSIFVNYKSNIINKIYEFLDDKYPALQVTAARTLAYMGIDDSLVIEKLMYYANGTDSQNWNLENTLIYQCLHHYLHYGGSYTKKELEQKRQRAIQDLKYGASQGLKIIYQKKNIKNDNKDLLYFNKIEKKESRDLDWDGNSSASYCNQWWGGLYSNYNPAYANYASSGGDCANFASQCLIAGYYYDIKSLSLIYPGKAVRSLILLFRGIRKGF